jgi:hypothetical protein
MDICRPGHEATCISQDCDVTYLSVCFNCCGFSHKRIGGTESTNFMSKVLFLSSSSIAEIIEEVFSGSRTDQSNIGRFGGDLALNHMVDLES